MFILNEVEVGKLAALKEEMQSFGASYHRMVEIYHETMDILRPQLKGAVVEDLEDVAEIVFSGFSFLFLQYSEDMKRRGFDTLPKRWHKELFPKPCQCFNQGGEVSDKVHY